LDSLPGRLTAQRWRLESPLRVKIIGLLQQTRIAAYGAERAAANNFERLESAFRSRAADCVIYLVARREQAPGGN
jgi:hypothetical protein